MIDISRIALINAADMPEDVLDYCVDHEIQTHYQNDVTFVGNNDNLLANWLRANGYKFRDGKDGDFIAILST